MPNPTIEESSKHFCAYFLVSLGIIFSLSLIAINPVAFADNYLPNIQRGLKLGQSFREIAMDFNRRGYKTRRGGDWHPSTIRNMLKRGKNEK